MTCEHVSISHPRHGNVFVALAAAIACIGDSHELGGKLVTKISLENSFFDQDRTLRRLAFVINIERAAPPRHRAVVNDSAFLTSNTFANEPGKSRCLFTIEISF